MMATTSTTTPTETGHRHTLSVARLLIAGGITAAVMFILCWLATFLPRAMPTRAYVGLFTPMAAHSIRALVMGALWSLIFGAIVGALFALIYNATASLSRR